MGRFLELAHRELGLSVCHISTHVHSTVPCGRGAVEKAAATG